ncbi:MAG: amidohydrolase [Oscillospiraceae bacterium]|nr:amidohydrolase [Oscillospiraceae bacterium]
MELMAIDSHTHINHGHPEDASAEQTPVYSAKVDWLYRVNDGAGIGKMLCSTFASVRTTEYIVPENEYLFDLTAREDRLYQWVVMDPRIPETFAQAERMLPGGKCVGIKLHPLYHKYDLPRYADKLFSFAAARRAVVLIHPEQQPDYIVPIADRYPDVTFIVAHLGDEHYVDAVANARHGNVWTDTSGIASSKNALLEYAVGRIGSQRILFGTDTYAAGFQRGRVEYALIEEVDKRNILRDNALRLFGDKLR